jgi:hypothetical protein
MTTRPQERTTLAPDPKALLGGTVAHSLAESEHALDAFIGQLGRGLMEMAEGRRAAGLRAADCQSAARRYATVIDRAVSLRGDLIETHAEFARTGRRARVDWVMFGPTESTPEGPVKDGTGGG